MHHFWKVARVSASELAGGAWQGGGQILTQCGQFLVFRVYFCPFLSDQMVLALIRLASPFIYTLIELRVSYG